LYGKYAEAGQHVENRTAKPNMYLRARSAVLTVFYISIIVEIQ